MPSSPTDTAGQAGRGQRKDSFRHRLRQGSDSGGEHLQLLYRHWRAAQPETVRLCNYNEYAEAKKEYEMGQFFTPHEVCRDMVDMLSPASSEMILDMCCGMGNFFNHLPNHHNTYGFDIDGKAVAVARYLYPDAHIEKCDIRQYYPEQRFDAIIGNPPFNLKFDYRLSQEYYLDKAYDVLNPAGILMVIVPSSFMQSEFWEKTRITGINRRFSFIGQIKLNPNAFASTGVHNFNTK